MKIICHASTLKLDQLKSTYVYCNIGKELRLGGVSEKKETIGYASIVIIMDCIIDDYFLLVCFTFNNKRSDLLVLLHKHCENNFAELDNSNKFICIMNNEDHELLSRFRRFLLDNLDHSNHTC